MIEINQNLEGEWVRIIDKEGHIYEGYVFSYVYPEDNEPEGIASVDIEHCPQEPGKLLGFYETDIQSIEIISKEDVVN